MKSYHPRNTGTKQSFEDKARYAQQFDAIGSADVPPAPREFSIQSGARKVLLTWGLAANDKITAHWRLYKDTEANLVMEIADRGTRQIFLDVTAGTTPPTYNFFVSGVSIQGREGPKVQAQGKALAETGAPSDPSVSSDFTAGGSGGGNTSYSPRQSSSRSNGGNDSL